MKKKHPLFPLQKLKRITKHLQSTKVIKNEKIKPKRLSPPPSNKNALTSKNPTPPNFSPPPLLFLNKIE
jgi:hypothetical protein